MQKTKSTTILAIETSCDETAIAVLRCSGGIRNPQFKVLSNIVSSQASIHARWGGVVPNIAKREHTKNLPTILKKALDKAKIKNPVKNIDVIAVTHGPGLEPALWAGVTFTQTLAQEWEKPIVAVNHMEGHIVASLLQKPKPSLKFPLLALLVSGGHTEIVYVKKLGAYTIVGETVDDAVGEAFDKVARMLDLSYPGGPIISKIAKTGNRYSFSFPRPMISQKNFNFSFSGLKTAVLYTLRDLKDSKISYTKNDIAASFEDAVADVLLMKTLKAMHQYKIKSLILGGGVAANSHLRERFIKAFEKEKFKLILPDPTLTTDNAAMIAVSAYFHVLKKEFTPWKKLRARATLSL